jgi:glycosyltransferase involved in cell wall biosynthesis
VRVGLVSQYFAPEIGATQNRMSAFAAGLAERGHEVVVVCEQPNHPGGVFAPGWGRRPLITSVDGPITVHRLWVATSPTKTTARRLAFYGTFAAGALGTLLTIPRLDVVLATSPPLPGAWAGAAAARWRRVPFVLDVRDLWPAAAAALGELANARALRLFERGERWIYQMAAAVTATTQPFCRHIDAVAGRQKAVHLPNGALDSLLALPAREPASGDFVVGYAGNMGIAQGLGIVLDAAAQLRDRGIRDVRFSLVGSGPMAASLKAESQRRGLDNVTFADPVEVDHVGPFLQSAHALLVPLRDHPLLEDFIPSKLYDAMAVGRPAIVAAGREAAAIVDVTGCGVVVPPEDGAALAAAAEALARDPDRASRLGAAGRRAAPAHSRSRQLDRLVEVLERAAGRQTPA